MKHKLPSAALTDGSNQWQLSSKLHELIHIADDFDRDLGLIFDVLSSVLHIAVCDHCKETWFIADPHEPRPALCPPGDVNGLLVAGGATCRKCLDVLYRQGEDMEEDEWLRCCQDVAAWLFRFSANRNCEFGRDPIVQDQIGLLARRY